MNVSICDACGSDYTGHWSGSESFHVAPYERIRVCGGCAKHFFRVVGKECDRLRDASHVAPEDMPTQDTLFGRWLAVRPLKALVGSWRKP